MPVAASSASAPACAEAVTGGEVALLVLGLAGGLSALGSLCIAGSGPVDRPRERGLHDNPTPTAGGIALIAGTCAAFLAMAVLAVRLSPEASQAGWALTSAAALGLFAALDDVFDVGARTKLLVQVAISFLFCAFVARVEAIPLWPGLTLSLGPVVGLLGSTLWMVVVVNAVNFIDGADGLAPGAMIIAFAGLTVAAWGSGVVALGWAALAAGAAGLGFLPFNFPRARLFQGDAGAFFSAALFAGLVLIGVGRGGNGPISLAVGPLLIAPVLIDVLITLALRAKRRARLSEAHRDHLYQRWLLGAAQAPWVVVAAFWALTAICAVCALQSTVGGAAVHSVWWLFLAPVGLVGAAVWAGFDRRLRRRG